MISFSQGGSRDIKNTSGINVFRGLAGSGNKIVGVNNNGNSKKISVDGVTIILVNDTLKASASDITSTLTSGWVVKWDGTKLVDWYNPATQSLSGTTPTYNINSGIDAKITISGNTTVSMQNLFEGASGTLFITNPATAYKIKFVGYNLDISASLMYDSNGIQLKTSSNDNSIGWKYINSKLLIHGTYYNAVTF